MNNNMPNNFNNNGGQNLNNMPNPMADRANEQMVQGQSAVGQGPNVMQGQGGVNTPGVMQSQNGVNAPGIMQGGPAGAKPEQPNVMPGQGNSGINAFTMESETPRQNTPGGAIPNLNNGPMPNIVGGPKVNEPVPSQGQNTIGIPNVPNQEPNNIGAPSIPNPGVNNAGPNPMNNQMGNQGVNVQGINQGSQIGLNNAPQNGPIMPNQNPVSNTPNVNPNPSVNNMNQTVNTMGNVNPANTQNVPTSNPNFGINNNSGIKPTPTSNVGMSPVGQTEVNHQAMPTDINIEEPKKKKFPLSTREMILVGIALVGVIVVIIMYI